MKETVYKCVIIFLGFLQTLAAAATTTVTTNRRLQTVVDAHTVQPLARDQVHSVWINGPSHPGQLGAWWPRVGSGSTTTYPRGHACDPTRPAYTGYHDNGDYCQDISGQFQQNPHLVVHSGNLGLVLDASVADGSFVRQLGGIANGRQSTAEIYQTLPNAQVSATLTLNQCTNLPGDNGNFPLRLTAGVQRSGITAQFDLIRHGHTVSHMVLHNLHWLLQDGTPLQTPDCAAGEESDPTDPICRSDYDPPNGHYMCENPDYPICVGFVEGESWGSCYAENSACNLPFPQPTLEVSVWPDLVSLQFHWDGVTGIQQYGCSGNVELSVIQQGGSERITARQDFVAGNTLVLLLTTNQDGRTTLLESTMFPDDLNVASSNGSIVRRDIHQDIFVEAPPSTPTCPYEPCALEDLIDVQLGNPKATAQTVRLSLTRNFPTRLEDDDRPHTPNPPIAEITGLNIIVMDGTGTVPLGIPTQLSKNWHNYYDGYYTGKWWTCNIFLRLPANAEFGFAFKIVYEKYGGVSAFSYAQLSLAGYSNKWLWEQGALGTGGESFCMDPLGSHTRAPITDVRAKLFDGKWKNNVGGGDLLLYFDNNGVMQSSKTALDSQLHVNGPCLSNVTHTSTTMDGAIHSRVQVSGGRTDDLVRMFIHLRYTAIRDVQFSRLAFFQMGSETYNKNALFGNFVFGSGGDQVTHNIPRTCSGEPFFERQTLYNVQGTYRETMRGNAPWWFSMAVTQGTYYNPNGSTTVVGDRSFIIRSYDAHLNGQTYTNPSISVLCDKVEVGTPRGVSQLQAGDYVDMRIEMIILPRIGSDFVWALRNSGDSRSLQVLDSLPQQWQRVQTLARHNIRIGATIPAGTRVESTHPIRVCVADDLDSVGFDVFGRALGFMPVVICNLSSPTIAAGRGFFSKLQGEADYTLLEDVTRYHQANYQRETGRYELVFNVEIQPEDGYISFLFTRVLAP